MRADDGILLHFDPFLTELKDGRSRRDPRGFNMASFLPTAAIAFIAGITSADPSFLVNLYKDAYPDDQSKRVALSECFRENHAFNRLDRAAREDCYRHALISQVAAQGRLPSAPPLAVNMVDLSRAAGRGSVPRNDVRAHQETDNFVSGRSSHK